MKFILTRELGRLANWLRILGFDAAYIKENNIGSLLITALREERIILTRNHRLPQSRGVRIILLENEKIKAQVAEVLKLFKLKPDKDKLFTRCIICNAALVAADKEKVKDRVAEYVFQTQDNFFTCPECQRIYWPGTHWGNVEKILEEIKCNS